MSDSIKLFIVEGEERDYQVLIPASTGKLIIYVNKTIRKSKG